MEADFLVRSWIADVLQAHRELLAIAVRQRAKFEGWLKFELAAYAQLQGALEVRVEASADDSSNSRADLTFMLSSERCDVELKTCNTNWRMRGVLNKTRPITKNLASIIGDARKLQNCPGQGVVAACIFPVEEGDMRWTEYLSRIADGTGLELSADRHAARVSIPIGHDHLVEVIIISFLTKRSNAHRPI
jgi:hypothetical protein